MSTLIYAIQTFTATDGTSCTKGNTYTLTDAAAYVAYQRGQAQPAELQENVNASTLNQLQYDAGSTGVPGVDDYGNLYGTNGTIIVTQEVPKYLGQVATRTIVPRQRLTTGKQANGRRMHIARDIITSPQFVFPNYMAANGGTTPSGSGEIGAGGSASIQASVEYPSGTFTRIKFSNNNIGIIPDVDTIVSDPVNGLVIPEGAVFWVRTFVEYVGAGNNVIYNTALTDNNYTVLGEAYEYGVSGITNKVMGGTITNTVTAGITYGPVAIISQTSRRSFLVVGDSRQAGVSSVGNYDSTGDVGEVPRSVGPKRAYIVGSTGGDKAEFWANSNTQRRKLMQWVSDVVIVIGINDILGGKNASELMAYINTIASIADGFNKKVYIGTLSPNASSSNNWIDYAGQTPDATESVRTAFNDLVRTTPLTNKRGIIDPADFFEVSSTGFQARNSGRWAFNGLNNAVAQDALHQSRQGILMLQRSATITNQLGI